MAGHVHEVYADVIFCWQISCYFWKAWEMHDYLFCYKFTFFCISILYLIFGFLQYILLLRTHTHTLHLQETRYTSIVSIPKYNIINYNLHHSAKKNVTFSYHVTSSYVSTRYTSSLNSLGLSTSVWIIWFGICCLHWQRYFSQFCLVFQLCFFILSLGSCFCQRKWNLLLSGNNLSDYVLAF